MRAAPAFINQFASGGRDAMRFPQGRDPDRSP